MNDRVSNIALLEAGLFLMKEAGKPLEKVPTGSRAMKYRLGNGQTVRVRTCNDHVLVVLADSADEGAGLNIEGTDHLLIVMPEVPRRDGTVIAYFVPTAVASKAVRRSHAEWIESDPATRGNNRTWNVWFDDLGTPWGGFSKQWSKYRLPGQVSTLSVGVADNVLRTGEIPSLGEVIATARESIARIAGVPVDAVKISIDLG